MAFHSHGNKKFEAQRVFTDREEPMSLFEKAFITEQERGDHRVLCWYGVGGQGKSSLHNEMRRRVIGNPDVALAGLNFDTSRHRHPEEALLKLRADFASAGLAFPTFDLAFAKHFASERPLEDIREVHPQLFRKGESAIMDDLIDWSESLVDTAVAGASLAVPGLNLVYKYGSRLTGRLADWWSSREVKDRLKDLDSLSATELIERLPRYMGFDIWRARAEMGCPRIVLTIDTHEKLTQGDLRTDAWLQSLVQEMPGVLVLIFGRDRLRWAELEKEWDNVLEQHLLGELSNEDADGFLTKVPIPEADIRERIVGASEGLPHYLDLAVSQYEMIRNIGGKPDVDDFGTTPSDVRDRFLDHLPASERRELFIASYTESLSEQLFLDLADAFLGGSANVSWARLEQRSFMMATDDRRLTMHALMRQALQEQDREERSELYKRAHKFLFSRYSDADGVKKRYFEALGIPCGPGEKTVLKSGTATKFLHTGLKTPNNESCRSFAAASFHAEQISREFLFAWLQNETQYKSDYVSLFEFPKALEQALSLYPEATKERAYILTRLAKCNFIDNRSAMLEEAAEIQKSLGGNGDVERLRSIRNLASALIKEDPKRALELYEQALSLCLSTLGNQHFEYLLIMDGIAHYHETHGETENAVGYLNDIANIVRGSDQPSSESKALALEALWHLWKLHVQDRNTSKAIEGLKTLLLRDNQLGGDEKLRRNTLQSLANLFREEGDLKQAAFYLGLAEERILGEQFFPHSTFVDRVLELVFWKIQAGEFIDAKTIVEHVLTTIQSLKRRKEKIARANNCDFSLVRASDVLAMIMHQIDSSYRIVVAFKKSEDQLDKLPAGDDKLLVRLLIDMAKERQRFGFTERTIPLLEKVLEVLTGNRVLTPDDDNYSQHLSTMSWLTDLQIELGRTVKADEICNRMFGEIERSAISDKKHAKPKRINAQRLMDVAEQWQRLKQWTKASEAFGKAKLILEETSEATDETYLELSFRQGETFQALKQFGNAIGCYERARDATASGKGKLHVYHVSALTHLSRIHLKMGALEEAGKLLKEALELEEKHSSKSSYLKVTILTLLSRAERSMKNTERAVLLAEQALEISRSLDGDKATSTATALVNLAHANMFLKTYETAEVQVKEALEIDSANWPETHHNVLYSHAFLAGLHAAQGRQEEADALINATIKKADGMEQDAAYWTGRMHLTWAHGLKAAGRIPEANAEARKALAFLPIDAHGDVSLLNQIQALIETTEAG